MFKLRIERIIEIKEKVIDDKKRDMETIVAVINRITDEISKIDHDIDTNYNNVIVNISNSNDVYVLKEYIIFLEKKKLNMIGQRKDHEAGLGHIKSELFELLKEVKMLETLRSKELKIIKKAQSRREQKMLDELALRIEERR